MTLHDFNKLDGAGKLITVWMKGTFLESHHTENETYKLYSLDMFYVEIKFEAAENRITEVISFEEGHLLDKYISNKKEEMLSQLINN